MCNPICGVMISVLASSVVDYGFEPQFCPKTIKVVFVASNIFMNILFRKTLSKPKPFGTEEFVQFRHTEHIK
jgi:hypothetical protein